MKFAISFNLFVLGSKMNHLLWEEEEEEEEEL